MKNSTIIVVLVIVIVLAGGLFLLSKKPADQAANTQAPAASGQTNTGPIEGPMSPPATTGVTAGVQVTAGASGPTVTFSQDGFTPKAITIKKGQSVTFVNQSGGQMWVASDPHPVHTNYDGTGRTAHCAAGSTPSFDECASGNSYTFTFDKAGTWNYHNHLNAVYTGAVIVQ